MIRAIQYCYTSTRDCLWDATTRAIDALNKTVKLIGEYNIGLIAFALACAYFHDYNYVVVYGVIGGVFYNQVNEVAQSVNAVYQACFIIAEPILDYRVFNYRILKYPGQTLMYGGGIFTFLLFKPITLLLAECYYCMRCGANLVSTSRRLLEEHKAKLENKQPASSLELEQSKKIISEDGSTQKPCVTENY